MEADYSIRSLRVQAVFENYHALLPCLVGNRAFYLYVKHLSIASLLLLAGSFRIVPFIH